MFDLTGEEREILENRIRELEEKGSFLDRVKLFFGIGNETREISDLLWNEDITRCSIEDSNAFYRIEFDDDEYVASYYDGKMRSGFTYLIRTDDLEEAVDAIEDHYLEGKFL